MLALVLVWDQHDIYYDILSGWLYWLILMTFNQKIKPNNFLKEWLWKPCWTYICLWLFSWPSQMSVNQEITLSKLSMVEHSTSVPFWVSGLFQGHLIGVVYDSHLPPPALLLTVYKQLFLTWNSSAARELKKSWAKGECLQCTGTQ